MAICTILENKTDSRKHGNACEFNGYLEDYLSLHTAEVSPDILEAFQAICQHEPNVKICVGLHIEISHEAISNQIIRYKDVFKLTGKPLTLPYLLYLRKEEEERAILVAEDGYIFAKALYYCMTEPGSEFIDCKNEIVAVSKEELVNTFTKLFELRAGALQRSIDAKNFKEYDDLKIAALQIANELVESAPTVTLQAEDRAESIRSFVVKWFLLKKILYVQYMVNKKLLASVHEGNVKKQRNQAKMNADEVTFISFSDMWRMKNSAEEE